MDLPDPWKTVGQLTDEFGSEQLLPLAAVQLGKSGIQISLDILIIAVPDAPTRQQLFPFGNIDDPVLARPVINISEQVLVDGAESCRRKIFKALLIQKHHVIAGLFSLHQIQDLIILDVQLVFQNRDILIEINIRHWSVPAPPVSCEKPTAPLSSARR